MSQHHHWLLLSWNAIRNNIHLAINPVTCCLSRLCWITNSMLTLPSSNLHSWRTAVCRVLQAAAAPGKDLFGACREGQACPMRSILLRHTLSHMEYLQSVWVSTKLRLQFDRCPACNLNLDVTSYDAIPGSVHSWKHNLQSSLLTMPAFISRAAF